MKVSARLRALKRVYPLVDMSNGRFMHATKRDLKKSGPSVKVYVIVFADDGRVSVHNTIFDRTHSRTVPQWADWLREHAPSVFKNQVLANLNRTYGGQWSIHRVIGWSFVD